MAKRKVLQQGGKRVKSNTGVASGYLHGFSHSEQDRLRAQARFLEHMVFKGVDFSDKHHIVELGCGVGAQTEILLERFPHLKVTGIDSQAKQIASAKKAHAGNKARVSFDVGDALHLPYADSSFDGAFICWFLEHVAHPVDILAELRRVLRTSAKVFISEVQNHTLYVHPYSPATLQYWFQFNDHQWGLGGDPFVGAKLANYLMAAGYQAVNTRMNEIHLDNRTPKRRGEFIDYWTALLLSGSEQLLSTGRVTPALVKEMTAELARLKLDPNAVFFYSAVFASAQVY